MKKNMKKLGLSLCAVLLLAGCSCKKEEDNSVKANINNGSETIVAGLGEDVNSDTLQKLYDDLKSQLGNEVAANKLLKYVADSIKSDATWNERYNAKINEKLLKLTEDKNYQIDGVFSEELLVKSLDVLYNVTCENNTYGPTYKNDGTIDEYLLCDYTSYINIPNLFHLHYLILQYY